MQSNILKGKESKSHFLAICLSIYFLSLPLGALNLSSQFGSLLKYIALIPIFALLISKPNFIKISRISFFQLLYIFLLLIGVFYSIEVSFTLQRVETNIMFGILLILMGSILFQEKDIGILKNALIWSSRLTCGLMIVFGVTEEDRLLLNGVISEDPNYINGYLLFGVVGAMQVLLSSNIKNKKLFAVVELMFYLYACLATGSRSGLFALIAASIIIFLFQKQQKILFSTGKKAGILVLLGILVIIIVNFIPENIIERFDIQTITESNGTGRYDLWEDAITIFESSPIGRQLFGYGSGTIMYIYDMYGYSMKVSHNIFVDHLMEGGVILLLVYCSFITMCLINAVKKGDIFTVAVLTGLILLSLAASLNSFKPYWNAILFSNLLIAYKKGDTENIKEDNQSVNIQ